MNNWQDFWNKFPTRFNDDDFFRQVGKTYQGKPITEKQFQVLINQITDNIQLGKEDVVLDLCCGNGLISAKIAEFCNHVVGIDFSEPLIKTANLYHRKQNISFYHLSAMDIDKTIVPKDTLFTKVYMYEALQHFTENQLKPLLDSIFDLSEQNVIVYLASILDYDRIWSFYHTEELKKQYYEGTSKGELLLGTWWKKDYIIKICGENNLNCSIIDQDSLLTTSHYRFDVLITKKELQ